MKKLLLLALTFASTSIFANETKIEKTNKVEENVAVIENKNINILETATEDIALEVINETN